ncbi:MAG: ribbon-helix-helix protein, CopG family [Deltaproteobacteria bacterium]|nr:ribbon-helix-helix protein, CopG family [Deltaproteobacteria bacterium]
MESQLTLRLPPSLATKLSRAARRLRRKRSEVVRLALEEFVETGGAPLEVRPIERVRDLLGRVESGIPDLGQRHREYLLRRLRRGR